MSPLQRARKAGICLSSYRSAPHHRKTKRGSTNINNLADKPQLPGRTIYAGNIHYKMNPAQLKDWFSHWGDVQKVAVVKDKLGQHTGRAFITFVQQSTADACWRDTDRRVLRNRRMVLEYAKPRGEGKKLFEELLQDQESSTDVQVIEQREDKMEALRNMPAFDVPPPKSSIKVSPSAS
ncbi:RNA-binding domain-containing protein [Cylindrobasidium torrendii FP15055 ss-10]|uniref:RNA-binding domain-containing protein n=1 Tax=Cylindrobasidium torrendii FP15055 ss-10 TaxID=1314674 RepID=A0A0D7BNQ4_9AGAR|nr:RNA-binding domain-containing protein [Cylindrobasidium torrendii FP15055 ss-10]